MRHFLEEKILTPIEREYEAWIINSIEEYLNKMDFPFINFAISTDLEKRYPTDQIVGVWSKSYKIFGLQFKRPKMNKNKKDQSGINCDRLSWNFSNPPSQLGLLKSRPEIFYCLPTFINRDYRKVARHHCLFWRPNKNNNDKSAWYSNCTKNVQTKNCELKDEMRWGLFIEQIMCCNVGHKYVSGETSSLTPNGYLQNYIDRIYGYLEEARVAEETRDKSKEKIPVTSIYFFLLHNFYS